MIAVVEVIDKSVTKILVANFIKEILFYFDDILFINYKYENFKIIEVETDITWDILKNQTCLYSLYNKNNVKTQLLIDRYWNHFYVNINKTKIIIPTPIEGNVSGNVVVVDMDDTFLNEHNQLMVDFDLFYNLLKTYYKYIVLWTFSKKDRLNSVLPEKIINKFDLVLTRDDSIFSYSKGVGFVLNQLARKFKVSNFTYSTLIDDCETNFTNDYKYFINSKFLVNYNNKFILAYFKRTIKNIYYIENQNEH